MSLTVLPFVCYLVCRLFVVRGLRLPVPSIHTVFRTILSTCPISNSTHTLPAEVRPTACRLFLSLHVSHILGQSRLHRRAGRYPWHGGLGWASYRQGVHGGR